MKKYFLVFAAAVFLLGGCASKNDNLFKKAVRFNAKGDTKEALKTYHTILRNNPDYFSALVNRAIIYEAMGEYALAEKDYERAFKIYPAQPDLLQNMGGFYVARKRPLTAIYYLNQAIEARPNFYLAYLTRASAYELLGKYNDALSDLETALSLRPDSRAAIERKALMDLRFLNVAKAVEGLSKALMMDPFNAKNYYRRAIAYKQWRRYANAMEDLNTAIRLNPEYVDALYARAQLHFKNVDHYAALGDLNLIKTINNQYVPAYDLSGDIYAIEDPVQAVANYLAARKLDPENASRYNAKINLMRTEQGRKMVITRSFLE